MPGERNNTCRERVFTRVVLEQKTISILRATCNVKTPESTRAITVSKAAEFVLL